MEIFLSLVRLLESTVGCSPVPQGVDNINMSHNMYQSCIVATGTSNHLLWASHYYSLISYFLSFYHLGSAESGNCLHLPWLAFQRPCIHLLAIQALLWEHIGKNRGKQFGRYLKPHSWLLLGDVWWKIEGTPLLASCLLAKVFGGCTNNLTFLCFVLKRSILMHEMLFADITDVQWTELGRVVFVPIISSICIEVQLLILSRVPK